MDTRKKIIDILIPAYNEEQNIGAVIEQVFSTLRDPRYRFDVIVVDDGSEDGTADVVKKLIDTHPVTLISLSRNFGKETALLAGLDHASGHAVIIMDADMQHPVELVPQFIDKWEAGYQSVYGIRQHRKDETILKALLTRLFYFVVNRQSKVRIEPNALDFRLLDRSVVLALRSVRERVRFMKGLYAWVGYQSTGIEFVPKRRHSGKSKFGAKGLLRLGWDGLTSFSDLPLRLAGIVGFVISSLSVCYAAYIALRTLVFGIDVPGWATLTVAITFLSGIQMFFLGIIGQYIRSIFIETKNRPSYLVSQVVASKVSLQPLDEEIPAEAEKQAEEARRAMGAKSDRTAVA
jgi:glycosyltransferase involved in cell wall biosynthesis